MQIKFLLQRGERSSMNIYKDENTYIYGNASTRMGGNNGVMDPCIKATFHEQR